MDAIYDALDAAAKNYPLKALAPEIDKSESTFRNELGRQPGYKLGLSTAVLIMKKTGDLKPLDLIEDLFGRVAFKIPRPNGCLSIPIMQIISRLTREFSESLDHLGASLEDGKLEKSEIYKCLKENEDLIKVCVELEAFLKKVLEEKK